MDKFECMEFWYGRRPGLLLFEQERARIDHLLARLPGQHLVQIGGPSDLAMVASSPIPHKVYLSLDAVVSPEVSSLQAELECLPFQANSLDVIVLIHALSCTEQPKEVIAQLFRALKPGGQLIMFGFNPLSLWGVSKLRRHRDPYPWRGKFYFSWRIKQCLRRSHFQLIAYQTLCFRGPTVSLERWHKRRFLEVLGPLILPGCGGAYMILAQKQQAGMTPLSGSWLKQRKDVVGAGYVEPSTRQILQVKSHEKN